MNSKFYVSYEAARQLKEKGYRQTYHAYYFGNSNLRKGGYRGDSWYDSPDFYPAPTKTEAIDWLESKGVVVEIQYNQESRTWSYAIYCIIYMSYDEEFLTRLEAEDAAIIKACKLLENGN